MAKGTNSKAVLIFMLVGIGGAGALAWYVKNEPGAARVPADLRVTQPEPSVHIERPTRTETPTDGITKPATQTILLPVIHDGKLSPETTKAEVPEGKDPKVFVTEEIVKAAKIDNARVLGVDVHNGVAAINFANGIDSGMGSEQEGLFLTALQQAFAQFPEVRKLELDKEGQPLESLGGHIDLTDGLPVAAPAPSAPKPSGP